MTVFHKVSIVTAGSDAAAQKQDNMTGDYAKGKQSLYLKYFFLPSSVGQTGGMPGRREVGHGMLAQNALAPIVADEVCTYTIHNDSTLSGHPRQTDTQTSYAPKIVSYTSASMHGIQPVRQLLLILTAWL